MTRNIKILNSKFLDISFDKEKYNNLNQKEKAKVHYINDNYYLSVDFLIGFLMEQMHMLELHHQQI